MTSVSYYPGCSLDATGREYGESTEAIFETLGIELKELDDWSCCGASSAHVTSDSLSVALPVRNLEIADKAGLDLVVPCAACFQRLKFAEKELLAGKDIDGISRQYEGNFQIKHLVDFMWENVGEETINTKIKKPLKDLKPVCYYGCLTTRPPKITDARNPENPQSMDKLLKSLGADVKNAPGAGAAGGLGAGLMAFLNAELKLGIDIVIDAAGLEGHLKDADLVITGEGMIDSQTIYGKTPIGVAKAAKKFGIPVIGIAGGISDDASVVYENGIDALMSIVSYPMSLEMAIERAHELVANSTERAMRLLNLNL